MGGERCSEEQEGEPWCWNYREQPVSVEDTPVGALALRSVPAAAPRRAEPIPARELLTTRPGVRSGGAPLSPSPWARGSPDSRLCEHRVRWTVQHLRGGECLWQEGLSGNEALPCCHESADAVPSGSACLSHCLVNAVQCGVQRARRSLTLRVHSQRELEALA